MKFTILGSTGFIGNALTNFLREKGHDVATPARNTDTLSGNTLGHVIYAIGMTGNFREHPDAAVDAHVNVLQRLMQGAEFESWLYLSSTRIYRGASGTTEDSPLSVLPNADTVYDLSKLLGESICLSNKRHTVRVARLSNVYGSRQSRHTFLGSVLADLKQTGKSVIGESMNSSKDYVSIEDACHALHSIVLGGKERIYNIASGAPITHSQLAEAVRAQGFDLTFSMDGPFRPSPQININRLQREFDFAPNSLLKDLPSLLTQ